MLPCCGGGGPLPITTGRVGLSQTSGQLTFYGANPRGVGMSLFTGYWGNCPPGQTPWLAPQQWGGCCGSCGCSPCCCIDNTKCFTALLTNLTPWCCYWQDRQYSAWLTGKDPWPSSANAAQGVLTSTLPAKCFPPLPIAPAPAPTH
jgi:hypothetical protein